MSERIDSADWTGLPSEKRKATGPYGDILTEAQDAAMFREHLREERRNRLRALLMLWGPATIDQNRTRSRGDGANVYIRQRGEEWTIARAIVATVAIIINRRHGRREEVLQRRRTGSSYIPSFDMGHWDARSDGYGYSVMCCNLYPGARVEIFSDGESWM